jgi:hypothetical protein
MAALNGIEVKIHAFPKVSIQQIYLCGFTLNIPVSVVILYLDKPLWVQCFLSDSSDEGCYALDSHSSDDASRIVIWIRGTNSAGKAFDGIAQAHGGKTVYKLNSIYDILVGRSLEESYQLPRRFSQNKKAKEDA